MSARTSFQFMAAAVLRIGVMIPIYQGRQLSPERLSHLSKVTKTGGHGAKP